MLNLRRFALHSGILVALVLGLLFACIPSVPAYPHPGPTVECDNYEFVPRNPDGSWTCPPPEPAFDFQALIDILRDTLFGWFFGPSVGDIVIGPYGETCVVVREDGYMDCNAPDVPGTPPIAPSS